MRKKTIFTALFAEFIALCAIQVFSADAEQTVFSAASLPFSLLGMLFGKIAGIGSIGNAIALVLICAVGMTPILFAVLRYTKKEDRGAQIVLIFTGILLILLLPFLANDTLLADRLPLYDDALLETVKTGICLTLWSCIVCFAVLRLLQLFQRADKAKLFAYAQKILYTLCVLFTGVIAFSLFGNLLSQWTQRTETVDRLLIILQFAANSANYVFDIFIALSAVDLFQQTESENTVLCAEKLCRRCTISLACMVGINTAFNALHILLLSSLSSFSVSLSVPILNIAFVLFIFLLARLIVENRKLHDDNDLFI